MTVASGRRRFSRVAVLAVGMLVFGLQVAPGSSAATSPRLAAEAGTGDARLVTQIGLLNQDTDPATGSIPAFPGLPGVIALDYQSRSLGADLGRQSAVSSIVLKSTGSTSTRVQQSNYSLWISDDNITYTEITGWQFAATVEDTHPVHTFTGLNAVGRYVKVHTDLDDTAYTFTMAHTNDDFQIFGSFVIPPIPPGDPTPGAVGVLADDPDPVIGGVDDWGTTDPVVADSGDASLGVDLDDATSVNGIEIAADSVPFPRVATAVGYLNQDTDPATGSIPSFPGVGGFGLDYQQRSLAADLGTRTQISTIVLKSTRSTSTRVQQSNYSLWVSDDNVTYTEITGWQFAATVENTHPVHTFTELNAVGRYVKVHTDFPDTDFTFFLANASGDDFQIFGAPEGAVPIAPRAGEFTVYTSMDNLTYTPVTGLSCAPRIEYDGSSAERIAYRLSFDDVQARYVKVHVHGTEGTLLVSDPPHDIRVFATRDPEAPDETKLVTFGDSGTALHHVDGTWVYGYPYGLRDRLGAAGMPVDVVNSAVTGQTTVDAVAGLPAVTDHDPDVVVVQFGLADSWVDGAEEGPSAVGVEDYTTNLQTIVTTLQGDGVRVIVLTPTPLDPGEEQWREQRLAEYAEAARTVADAAGAELVDAWAIFQRHAGLPGRTLDELLTTGNVPGNEGHKLLADALMDVLIPGLSGSIAGTVTDAGTGAGIADASVQVRSGDDTVAQTTSGSDGRYTLTDVPDGTYDVAFTAADHQDLVIADVDVAGGSRTGGIDAAMTSLLVLSSVSGVVSGAGASGLAGVTVSAFAGQSGDRIDGAVSGDSGGYTVTDLPAGSYVVCFDPSGASGSPTGWIGECHPVQADTADGVTLDVQLSAQPAPQECDPTLFDDVGEGSTAFCTDITWLAGSGVTTGVDATHFAPAGVVSRGQMALFLFRLSHPGEQDPECSSDPVFVDVAAASAACGAISWLADSGVTTGVDATHFAPAGVVTRGQMAAFLYRMVELASVSGTVSDESGDGIQGVSVVATGSGDSTGGYATETGPDGSYHIAGMAAGTYTVCFDPTGAGSYQLGCYEDVSVAPWTPTVLDGTLSES